MATISYRKKQLEENPRLSREERRRVWNLINRIALEKIGGDYEEFEENKPIFASIRDAIGASSSFAVFLTVKGLQEKILETFSDPRNRAILQLRALEQAQHINPLFSSRTIAGMIADKLEGEWAEEIPPAAVELYKALSK